MSRTAVLLIGGHEYAVDWTTLRDWTGVATADDLPRCPTGTTAVLRIDGEERQVRVTGSSHDTSRPTLGLTTEPPL